MNEPASYELLLNLNRFDSIHRKLILYTLAKKGYGRPGLHEIQTQVKKAMDLSFNAMAAAQKCNK